MNLYIYQLTNMAARSVTKFNYASNLTIHLFDRCPLIFSVHAMSSGQIWSRLMWNVTLTSGRLCKCIGFTKDTYVDLLCQLDFSFFMYINIVIPMSVCSPAIKIVLTIKMTTCLYFIFTSYPNDHVSLWFL